MNRVLIVAEHADGKLNAAVAKCVACARAIPDADVSIAVLAADGSAVAAAAAAIQGVSRVLLVKNPANEPALAAVLAPQVAKLADGAAFVLGPVHDLRQGPDAARRGPDRRAAALRRDGGGIGDALSPAGLRGECHRDRRGSGRPPGRRDRARRLVPGGARPAAPRRSRRSPSTSPLPTHDAFRVGVRGPQRPTGPADRHARRLRADARSAAPRTSR